MSWKMVTMTASQLAAGEHGRLQDLFEKCFFNALGPEGAVMLARDDGYREWNYIFSPEAVRIFDDVLSGFNAQPTGKPQKNGTSLLIGHANALDVLL